MNKNKGLKMNRMNLKKRYGGVGFVEALLAIAVAGIASVILMTIAANTVAQVVRNEVADKMTESAIQGAAIVKKIADNHNNSEETLFPSIEGNVNRCFLITGDTGEPSFEKSGEVFTNACSYDSGEREQCKEATLPSDEDMFRVFCITSESDSERGLVVGKVIVGLKDCNSVIANSKCELRDYEYYTAVKVNKN